MALTINPATKEVTIPQADLTFVSGTLYDFDTLQFMRDLNALLDDEDYIWMDTAFDHSTQKSLLGIVYSRIIEMINSWNITFENTGSAYTVRYTGSNNNLFDIESGVLNPTALVTPVGNNSAGLINLPELTLVKQILANGSVTVDNGDGSCTVTLYDTDDNSGNIIGVWVIDDTSRERTT